MKGLAKAMFIAIQLLSPTVPLFAAESTASLERADIDPHDKASLQRGARLFMNYCAGCHSLKYLRYQDMARAIGVTQPDGTLLTQLVTDSLVFTGAKLTDTIQKSMRDEDAKQWFGVAPPDLSLTVRQHGIDWIYTYLTSFYSDPNRPLGVNNVIFPSTAMPNVLVNLQGVQKPVFREVKMDVDGELKVAQEVDHLTVVTQGEYDANQFVQAMNDLINFLAYVSDPTKLKRYQIGPWVIFFGILLAFVAYLLKREYWKDILGKTE